MTKHPYQPKDKQEKQFEKLLQGCFEASPTDGFSSRIMSAAFARKQIPPQPFLPWLKDYVAAIVRTYHLPNLVATGATIVILGIGIGFGFSLLTNTEGNIGQFGIGRIFYGEQGLL